MDERLLRRIDADPEAREHGRSAFLRRAAACYLEARRERAIAEKYRRAYTEHPIDEHDDLYDWMLASEGAWRWLDEESDAGKSASAPSDRRTRRGR